VGQSALGDSQKSDLRRGPKLGHQKPTKLSLEQRFTEIPMGLLIRLFKRTLNAPLRQVRVTLSPATTTYCGLALMTASRFCVSLIS
jgi:hypothetical protein